MRKPCSGLGSEAPCERRKECANYSHWMEDRRSAFNLCTPTGQPFKHFAQAGTQSMHQAQKIEAMQWSLF